MSLLSSGLLRSCALLSLRVAGLRACCLAAVRSYRIRASTALEHHSSCSKPQAARLSRVQLLPLQPLVRHASTVPQKQHVDFIPEPTEHIHSDGCSYGAASTLVTQLAAVAKQEPPITPSDNLATEVPQLVMGPSAMPTSAPPGMVQPAGFKKTFYKRQLPNPPCTAFSSQEGRVLFQEALQDGTANGFFKLMEQFSTQDEPAFCGLTTLAMVLNSLAIDPRRIWKGAWRWFHEQMLDCCKSLAVVKEEGIVFTQVACLARCNGARVDMRPSGTFTEEEFRQQVIDVCRGSDEFIVLSYSRKLLSQTGDGHFSPVGAYHAGRDLVLVLDVARFKYPPHWVPLPIMYQAMASIDKATGQPRGFMRISAHPLLDSVLFTLDIRSDGWRDSEHFIRHVAPAEVAALASIGGTPAEQIVERLLDQLPLHSLDVFLVVRTQGQQLNAGPPSPGSPQHQLLKQQQQQQQYQQHQDQQLHRVAAELEQQQMLASTSAPAVNLEGTPLQQLQHAASVCTPPPPTLGGTGGDRCIPHGARAQLLHELRCMPLFQVVRAHLSSPAFSERQNQRGAEQQQQPPAYLAEKATMLLLLQPHSAWPATGWVEPGVQQAWAALTDVSGISIVEGEVRYLREQLAHIDAVLQSGHLEPTCAEACSHRLDCAAHGHA